MHFDELTGLQHLARHAALGAERRDERHQHDQTGIGHQPGNLGDASDIFHPVGICKAEVPVQAVAHIVTVQQIGVVTHCSQALLDDVGNSGLAGTGQAGEPQYGGLLVLG